MSRVWHDDEPQQDPISTAKAIAVIAVVALVLILATSCTVKQLPEGAEPIPLPTAPPALDLEVCDQAFDTEISTYIPENWSVWCDTLSMTVGYVNTLPAGERNAICAEFWETPDSQLLISYEGPRSEAIGFIDALWMVC